MHIDCDYGYYRWSTSSNRTIVPIVSGFYACLANITGLRTQRKVTGISSNHLSGKSDKNVKIIKFYGEEQKQLPKDIEKYFANLIGLFFNKCGLETVTKDDLKPFSKLKFLSLSHNYLKTLSDDLFDYTPRLLFIGLAWNNLTNIGRGILDNLEELQKATFNHNDCIDKVAINDDRHALEELKMELLEKCPPTKEMKRKQSNKAKSKGLKKKSAIGKIRNDQTGVVEDAEGSAYMTEYDENWEFMMLDKRLMIKK